MRGHLAQWLEHLAYTEGVGGSKPSVPSLSLRKFTGGNRANRGKNDSLSSSVASCSYFDPEFIHLSRKAAKAQRFFLASLRLGARLFFVISRSFA